MQENSWQHQTKASNNIFSSKMQLKDRENKPSNSSDIQSEINISRYNDNDNSYDESSDFKKQKSTKGLSGA